MANPIIQTTNLDTYFKALRDRDPAKLSNSEIPSNDDYKDVPRQNYAPTTSVEGAFNGHLAKYASAAMGGGVVYGQPQFFSPVHTPINWQIPSKRIEIYQWCRFFYENEAKVASSIDFYSYFPMNSFTNECRNKKVKRYFDRLSKRLELAKWCRLISHEVHKLGDCFPFVEVGCNICGGSGRIGDEICDHEGGTIRRIVILNPDFVEVETSPMNPDPIICLKPDEELINMVQKRTPGFDRLAPEVRALVSAGKPIRLDNRNVSHIMYGESGYAPYGVGMIRRLFQVLSYKTKLMVAQWIVAERLIVPIKIVKVGSDERPAGPADIAAVQQQLAQTANDPNLTIVTHHAFSLEWEGASGKVLALSNEFDLINQEILDGMMINNALLNGEGPSFSNAAVGIEAMVERLETFRREIALWIEERIYLPEAIRQGFIDTNADGEEEYVYPKIKWNSMHLRDLQQDKTFALQLYEKGILSAQTLLELFGYDPDLEIERKRDDAIQLAALGQGMGADAGAGGMGGGFAGDLGGGGAPPMGGGDMGGGDMGGAPMGGGDMGAPPGGGGDMGGGAMPAPISASTTQQSLTSEVASPANYGGKVLKKKSREKVDQERQLIYQKSVEAKDGNNKQQGSGLQIRDAKGRIIFTKPERLLMKGIVDNRQNGLIRYPVMAQHAIKCGTKEYPLDFAIPNLKIGLEADGEAFHSSPKQVAHDRERDQNLSQQGWTILRFTEDELENNISMVMNVIIKNIMQKESLLKQQEESLKK